MTLEYPSWSRVAVLCLASTIGITGGCINITEARETGSQSSEQKFKQSGLTLVSCPSVRNTSRVELQHSFFKN